MNKSQVITFGSRANLRRIDLKSIDVFGAAVPISSSILSLGVTFDSCLTWHKHIDSVIGKSIGMLIRLSLLRRIMPLKTIVLLINTLVRWFFPIFDFAWQYGVIVMRRNVEGLTKLSSSQNALRVAKQGALHGMEIYVLNITLLR